MAQYQLIRTVSVTFALVMACTLKGQALAQERGDASPKLPGYYEFFMKTGKLTRLASEVKRDDQIQTGKIKPVAVNKPVVGLTLPDGFGNVHNTRSHIGKRNLVLVTGRAWW